MTPHYWDDAKAHIAGVDPVMEALMAGYPEGRLQSRGKPFYTLLRAIVGQQVSVASADSLWAKMEDALAQRGLHVHPEAMNALDDDTLRACGFSRQKLAYTRHLSAFFLDHALSDSHWDAMSDHEVTTHITQIKGIGRWSAEMFLMFCLLRSDVFPLDDIGLHRAMKLHYLPPDEPFDRDAALRIAAPWQPYRSVALWYLWRSIDPSDVAY